MFCCLSPRPNPTLNARDLETMRVFAGLATRQLHLELEQEGEERRKRSAVRKIIETEAFDIVLQPIFDLASMRTTSVEALCRFRPEPYRSPDRWFQDAADVGLGIELELAAVRAAVTGFAHLPRGVSMSVNASPAAILGGGLSDVLGPDHLARTIVEGHQGAIAVGPREDGAPGARFIVRLPLAQTR